MKPLSRAPAAVCCPARRRRQHTAGRVYGRVRREPGHLLSRCRRCPSAARSPSSSTTPSAIVSRSIRSWCSSPTPPRKRAASASIASRTRTRSVYAPPVYEAAAGRDAGHVRPATLVAATCDTYHLLYLLHRRVNPDHSRLFGHRPNGRGPPLRHRPLRLAVRPYSSPTQWPHIY